MARSLLEWLLLSIPFIWIILTLVFIFVAYYNFKYTEEGYRFSVVKILFINIGVVLILGLLINASGLSVNLNSMFSNTIPYYNKMMDTRLEVWMRPDSGYLSGTITSVYIDSVDIEDFYGNTWTIGITNSLIRGKVSLKVGNQIKIVGVKLSDNTFEASEIRPWNGVGMGNIMNNCKK
jgi:hypothetical protein